MVDLNTDIITSSFVNPFDKKGNKEVDPVTIWVDGVFYNPWIDISIQRNLDSMSGSCSMSFVDRWRTDKADWPLAPDKEISVKIGSEPLITGYIDVLNVDVTKDSRSVSVECRDKTADLADCSHDGVNKISKTTFLGLATTLCAPFGITALFQATPVDEPFSFESEQSETVFDALMRYATPRGYLLQTDSFGNLVVLNRELNTRLERSTTDLVQGKNILDASANYDHSNRFSKYTVKGQAPGNDLVSRVSAASGGNTTANSSKGEATDENVTRYRPKVIISDDKTSAVSAQKQAEWEADIRSRQSTSVGIKVQGWRKGDGSLWKINDIVRVDAGFIGVNQDMLITGVTYEKSISGGTVSVLELTTPDSFKAEKRKTQDDSAVKRPLGWQSPGAAGSIEAVAKLFGKRLS